MLPLAWSSCMCSDSNRFHSFLRHHLPVDPSFNERTYTMLLLAVTAYLLGDVDFAPDFVRVIPIPSPHYVGVKDVGHVYSR